MVAVDALVAALFAGLAVWTYQRSRSLAALQTSAAVLSALNSIRAFVIAGTHWTGK